MQDEPRREGGESLDPEGFPTGAFLLVGLLVVLGVIAIGATFVTAGIGGMIIAGLVIIFVGVPMAIRKRRRPVDNPRQAEAEAARQRAASDAADLHPPVSHPEPAPLERSAPSGPH
jgi:hypothetical protein